MNRKLTSHLRFLIVPVLALAVAALACGRGQQPAGEQPPITIQDGSEDAGSEAGEDLPPDPTSTTAPGSCAASMAFVADVTVPDGTLFGPGEAFVKTWRVTNDGTCDWTGYRIVFADGEPMGTLEQSLPDLPAGETLDISVEMTAPGGVGDYVGRWRIESAGGANLGHLTCVISVSDGPPAGDEPVVEEPVVDEPQGDAPEVDEPEEGGLPDLIAIELVLDPNPQSPINDFSARWIVMNQGDAPAPASVSHFRLAGMGPIFTCDVPALVPTQAHACDSGHTLVTPQDPMNYGAWADADVGNAISESDEGNNTASGVLEVRPHE